MIGDKKLIALIPARAGSKRLPGKNMLEIGGKPMIHWTIEASQNSNYVDRVVVSTDDHRIAELARQNGVDVPFIRPAHLATETATSVDVIKHTLDYLQQKSQSYAYLVLLQPTSPLRKARHIDESVELLIEKSADSVVSVVRSDFLSGGGFTVESSLRMHPDNPDLNKALRGQDYPEKYWPNGAIYLINVAKFQIDKTLYPSEGLYAYKMSKLESIDVDDHEDYIFAGVLFSTQR